MYKLCRAESQADCLRPATIWKSHTFNCIGVKEIKEKYVRKSQNNNLLFFDKYTLCDT